MTFLQIITLIMSRVMSRVMYKSNISYCRHLLLQFSHPSSILILFCLIYITTSHTMLNTVLFYAFYAFSNFHVVHDPSDKWTCQFWSSELYILFPFMQYSIWLYSNLGIEIKVYLFEMKHLLKSQGGHSNVNLYVYSGPNLGLKFIKYQPYV
jgi:hypothetical protein